MPSLLLVDNVSKSFHRGRADVTVLNEVTFSVDERQLVAIVGPSGCGKSTLLRLIMGLERPTTGQVTFRGEAITKPLQHMAMVFQNFALFPWLSVLENVELGLEAMGMGINERRKKSLRVIQEVGLEGFEEAFPRELSGGMKQRVGLARALATDPDVLLMDEPFSSLDALTATNLREEVLKIWENKFISPEVIIMVTHNVEEAVYMSDRVIALTRRPASIAKDLPIALSRPREKRSDAIYKLVDEITTLIA